MPLALFLLVGGVLIPNPSATGMTGVLDRLEPARGVLRITRHPVMWGVGLWAAVHLVANGDLASLLFFGGFLLNALGRGLASRPAAGGDRRRPLAPLCGSDIVRAVRRAPGRAPALGLGRTPAPPPVGVGTVRPAARLPSGSVRRTALLRRAHVLPEHAPAGRNISASGFHSP